MKELESPIKTAPETETKIDSVITRMDGVLAVMETSVGELEKSLVHLSLTPPPTPSSELENKDKEPRCAVINRFVGVINRICSITKHIETLNEGLDV